MRVEKSIVLKLRMSGNASSDFIKQLLGRPVIVKLNSGVTYQGIVCAAVV